MAKVRIIFGQKIFTIGDHRADIFNQSGRVILITKDGTYSLVIDVQEGEGVADV